MLKSLLLKPGNSLMSLNAGFIPNMRIGLFSIVTILSFNQNSIAQTKL